jgi:aminoglycoside phosphotransferase (APT) family kinase protein
LTWLIGFLLYPVRITLATARNTWCASREEDRLADGKMHPDEVTTDVPLVRRLLAAQFPHWAALPIRPVRSAGSDNAIYRLGDDMVVRLPRRTGRSTESLDKECQWLPRLAPLLPLAIPVPLRKGAPAEGYPSGWAVYRWLEGVPATSERLADVRQAATDLARFVTALQRIDATGGPHPGAHNFYRGVPLATRDGAVRSAIASLNGAIEVGAVTAAWEAALRAPAWDGPPVWIHGDLYDGNLLVERGRLSAVIDFGGLGIGDPGCDLIVAWSLLPTEAREVFRSALAVDDATWARGRGWALSVSLIALPYYWTTNPVRVADSWHRIGEVLADEVMLHQRVHEPEAGRDDDFPV